MSRIGDVVCSPDKSSYACFGQSPYRFSIESRSSGERTFYHGGEACIEKKIIRYAGYKTSGSWLDEGRNILVSDSCGSLMIFQM